MGERFLETDAEERVEIGSSMRARIAAVTLAWHGASTAQTKSPSAAKATLAGSGTERSVNARFGH